jgi:hypothetical protein
MDNLPNLGNKLVDEFVRQLKTKLPQNWQIDARAQGPSLWPNFVSTDTGIDAVIEIQAPGTKPGSLLIAIKRQMDPRDVDPLAKNLRPTPNLPVMVLSPFLGPRTQARLKANGFGYADLTGNIRLSLSSPALFIETTGDIRNPTPSTRERKSLKGAKAGRLVRALCDFRPPMGLRLLAKRAGVDPGYASRIVDILDREALVIRVKRGPITQVDWTGLLRRWSQEYSPFQRRRVEWHLAPRGVESAIGQLKSLSDRYAVSGSWAAAQLAPVAPPRLLLLYADDRAAFTEKLNFKPVEVGANVAVATPFDSVVYERTSRAKGVTIAAASQVAVDLLTGPGRSPNEAEALMNWMAQNENAWRT